MRLWLWLVSCLFLSNVLLSTAEQCGAQNQGLPCPGGICCSELGWCGTTDDYCLVENGCQMNCTDGPPVPVTPPPPGATGQCGEQNYGHPCHIGYCCSRAGFCGTTDDYCLVENGCQMNCTDGPDAPPSPVTPPPPPSPITPPPPPSPITPPPPPSPVTPPPPPSPVTPPPPGGGSTLGDIISRELFDEMLPMKDDPQCHAVNFYTYEAFLAAAKSYPAFAATGDDETRKREVAAFLGQTSHETTGWWPAAQLGQAYWGYCWNEEMGCPDNYCTSSVQYPCVPGAIYCGRGPIQLTGNVNYGQYGDTIGLTNQLLQNPAMLLDNATMAFEASYWFWMTAQPPKPSCHDVITGLWTPSEEDIKAGRLPGYGMLTNIINGGLECGHGEDTRVKDRIVYYERYTEMYGISPGDNLDCYNMEHYPNALVQSM